MKVTINSVLELAAGILLLFVLMSCTDNGTSTTIGIQLQPQDVVIENTTLIDAINGERKGMTLIIREGQILHTIPATQLDPVDGVKFIDGTDKFLIPGLWDAHVHITFDPELENSMYPLFLANGITSVRDTGGKLELVLAARERARSSLAPDVYIAGPLIDGVHSVYTGEVKGYPDISETVTTAEEAENLVDKLAAAEVDLVKAYEMLTPEAFKAVINRAKHHGLPVTGHVPLSMTAIEATDAGLNSMEHTRNFEMDCSEETEQLFEERKALLQNIDGVPGSTLRTQIHGDQHYRAISRLDNKRCVDALKEIAGNNTWQVPTQTLVMASRSAFFIDDAWRDTFAFIPEPKRTSWLNATERFKKIMSKPSDAREQRAQVSDWKEGLIPQMIDANIRIMAGTDTPIFFLTPGFSLHKELETLVDAGMSPMQALESATLAPAEYFGLHKKQGLIEPGHKADLVLLNANPLEDIGNTTQIHMVIKDRTVLDREALNGLLEESANQAQ